MTRAVFPHPTLREQVRTGTAVGTFCDLPGAMPAEIVAAAGFDVVCLDAEHGALGLAELDAMIRGAEAAGVPAIVRVPAVGPDIARALDLGAAGVLVPKVESAAQAAEVVDRARFAPAGSRGVGPGRAGGYSSDPGYVTRANDQVVVAVQLETAAGLANAAAICAVPGIDVIFVGPVDLAASLGVDRGSPELMAAIADIFAAAEAAGLARGAFCFTAADVARTTALTRVGLLMVGADFLFLRQAATTALAEARAAIQN